eukprot:2438008-Rhodomonas_salina.1
MCKADTLAPDVSRAPSLLLAPVSSRSSTRSRCPSSTATARHDTSLLTSSASAVAADPSSGLLDVFVFHNTRFAPSDLASGLAPRSSKARAVASLPAPHALANGPSMPVGSNLAPRSITLHRSSCWSSRPVLRPASALLLSLALWSSRVSVHVLMAHSNVSPPSTSSISAVATTISTNSAVTCRGHRPPSSRNARHANSNALRGAEELRQMLSANRRRAAWSLSASLFGNRQVPSPKTCWTTPTLRAASAIPSGVFFWARKPASDAAWAACEAGLFSTNLARRASRLWSSAPRCAASKLALTWNARAGALSCMKLGGADGDCSASESWNPRRCEQSTAKASRDPTAAQTCPAVCPLTSKLHCDAAAKRSNAPSSPCW